MGSICFDPRSVAVPHNRIRQCGMRPQVGTTKLGMINRHPRNQGDDMGYSNALLPKVFLLIVPAMVLTACGDYSAPPYDRGAPSYPHSSQAHGAHGYERDGGAGGWH